MLTFSPLGILFEAITRIASWDEGREVNGSFDEPVSAKIARDALLAYSLACYGQMKEKLEASGKTAPANPTP